MKTFIGINVQMHVLEHCLVNNLFLAFFTKKGVSKQNRKTFSVDNKHQDKQFLPSVISHSRSDFDFRL